MSDFDINAFRDGDAGELEKLFQLYFQPLCRFARGLIGDAAEAEDIALESFLRVWEIHTNFEKIEKIRGYLYLNTRHRCLNSIRDKKRKVLAETELAHLLQEKEEQADFDELENRVAQYIYEQIERLPDRCREIFKLIYLEQKTTADIAVQLGITEGTVRVQKSRAVTLIRSALLQKQLLPLFYIILALFLSYMILPASRG